MAGLTKGEKNRDLRSRIGGRGLQQGIQLTPPIKGMDIITAPHMLVVDKDLGQTAPAISPLRHLLSSRVIAIDGVLCIIYSLSI
jgi:hypothetical protein